MAIILASQSPRRKEILTELGLEFKIIVSDIDESIGESDPINLVETLARMKAEAVLDKISRDDIVISADTVVVLGDKILGKPRDLFEAKETLKNLSGNQHEVITGVCVKKREQTLVRHDITKVYFKNISDQEILEYLSVESPLDKAGSYAIQGYAGRFVEKIEGSYTNVVGLPKELISHLLYEIKKSR